MKSGAIISSLFSKLKYTAVIIIFISINTGLAAQHFENNGIRSFGEISKSGLPPGWDYQSNTENPHGVIVVLGANPRINNIPIQYGDYIGAFYEDDNGELKCGGADFWNGTENIIFAVFGNDPSTPEKDGFSYGEVMHFKIFYQDNQKAYDVTSIQWDPEFYSTNIWSPLGLSAATDMICEVDFDAYASADQNPLCIGQTVNLEGHIFVPTTGNYTWQWTSIPAGLISDEQSTSHTPAETTTYVLEVSDGTNISTHELTVVVHENPEIDAGDPVLICLNQQAEVSATAVNASGVMWTTSGDGTFQAPGASTTTYYPGEQDRQNLRVTLFITALPLDPCQGQATDSTMINMQIQPAISAPTQLEFCEGQPMIIQATASDYSGVSWITSGDGTFLNPDSLTTTYFPGSSDLSINEFDLTVQVGAVSPCTGNASAQINVTTHNPATLAAPSSKTACQTSPVTLNSLASNYTTSLWTTAGDGTFLNPSALNTVYYPGPQDKAANGTIVTIHAFGTGICQDYDVVKNIQLNLLPGPEAIAGPDAQICQGGTIQLQGGSANTSFITWTTSGDGYFDNPYIIAPVYHPGPQDNNSDSFQLYLTAYAVYPCTVADIDTTEIFVLPEPQVDINSNVVATCFGNNYTFSAVTAAHYSSLDWFTINGQGTFDDPTILHPAYIPDPGHDYPLGSVIIGVTASPNEPCLVSADDYVTLQFQAPPTVFAGGNDTVVRGDVFIPQPDVENYSSVLWQTTGDGTFSDPTTLSPEYLPGTNDNQNFGTQLIITAFPTEACDISTSDTLNLTIPDRQVIHWPEGGNSFSSYIDFGEKTFESVLGAEAGKVIFAQHFGEIYWPEYGINTIGNLSNAEGLRIVTGSDAEIRIDGFEVAGKSIQLRAGWNILPVLVSCPVETQEIATVMGDALIMIAGIDSPTFFMQNDPTSTLTTLDPGKAYFIKVNSGQNLTFPSCDNFNK